MPGSRRSSVEQSSIGGESGAWNQNVGREADGMPEERAFMHGVMGVLYTVCKEKARYTYTYIAFRMVVDWLQLWLLVVQPPQFDLPHDKLWWQIIDFIGLTHFMAARGYTFFLVCFYLLVAGLLLSVVLCIWVGWSFQRNQFQYVWPVEILRWFAKIFYQMLDIMSLSLFLMALDCQFFGRDKEVIGHNTEFPDVYCWSMPHIIHATVAAISTILFVLLAGAFTVGEMELDFTTRNDLAIKHTSVELMTFALAMAMAFVAVFVYNPKWQSAAQLLLSSYKTFLAWYWQFQLVGWVNHMRVGTYASVAWCSFLYVFSAFNLGWDASDPDATEKGIHALTIVMWVTTIPMGCLGAWASWLRLRYLNTIVLDKFRGDLPEDLREFEDVFEFEDSRFAEILSRCCRVWVSKYVLQPQGVHLAEKVLQVGLAQMPNDPFMHILYSSFLMDVQKSYQSGYAQLQAAKKLDLSFLMRFAIFSREQQHEQRDAADVAGGSHGTDLVSYVEFQRYYSMALKAHRATLRNMQHFWECLLHKTVRFQTLADTIQDMDRSIRKAEDVYRNAMQSHASSVKIVRLYAKFLEHVKQDPWAAARWFSEADRLEAAEEELRRLDVLGAVETDDPAIQAALVGAGPTGHTTGRHAGRAVVVINASSTITLATPACHSLLGYTPAELVNKNLRVILPPALGESHTSYVRNYIQTGRSIGLGRTLHQVALHKDKYMVPVYVTVSKISGIGEDTTFMGILEVSILTSVGWDARKPVPMPSDMATVWVMPDGTVLTVSPSFTDWFAWTAKDVQGQALAKLLGGATKEMYEVLVDAHDSHVKQAAMQYTKPLTFKTPWLFSARVSQPGTELGVKYTEAGGSPQRPSDLPGQVLELATDAAAMGSAKQTRSDDLERSDSERTSLPIMAAPVRSSTQGLQESEGSWMLPGVPVVHKYALPTECNILVENAGVGCFGFHVLNLRRKEDRGVTSSRRGSSQPGTPQPRPAATLAINQRLMLVVSSKGQVLHVTSALGSLLGRTLQPGVGYTGLSVIEQAIAKPFGAMHKALVQGAPPMSIPPYSCRSGLSVLLQSLSPQGQPVLYPARLSISKKVLPDDNLHVVLVEARTMEQAVAERRLLLELDGNGIVTKVHPDTPASLFGCEFDKLLGKHACSFLDVLRPPGAQPSAELDSMEKEHGLAVLVEMAAPALEHGSSCWRVGFITPDLALSGNADSKAAAKVRSLMMAAPRPALLRLRVSLTEEDNDEEGGVAFQMELWRADMSTNVIEVDKNGIIHPPEFEEVGELYPQDLVLGTSLDEMLDQHISSFITDLTNRPVTDLLSAEGLVTPSHQLSGRLRPQKRSGQSIISPHGSNFAVPSRTQKKGKVKTGSVAAKRSAHASLVCGPPQLLTVVHQTDKAELKLTVQAVRRFNARNMPDGVYLVIQASRPTAGRANFQSWLTQQVLKAPLANSGGHRGLHKRLSIAASVLAKSFVGGSVVDMPRLPSLLGLTVTPASPLRQGWAAGNPRLDTGHFESPFRRNRVYPDKEELSPSAKRQEGGHDEALLLEPPRSKGRVRVDSWVDQLDATPTATHASFRSSANSIPSADRPSKDSSAQLEVDSPRHAVAKDGDVDADVPDDESEDHEDGVEEADYMRGQRFKRLLSILNGAIIQAPISSFRRQSLVIAILICAIQITCFVVMRILVEDQKTLITGLTQIGLAGACAAELALYSRSLNIIYANMTVPGLRWISDTNDLPHMKQALQPTLDDFLMYHQASYLGMDQAHTVPDSLRALWEAPSLTITNTDPITADQAAGNFTIASLAQVQVQTSLWLAGQELAQHAANLVQNADAFNASLTTPGGFQQNLDLIWIANNTAQAIVPAYLITLDSYVEATISSAVSLNNVQLVTMVIDGVVCCGLVSLWMWYILQRVAKQRFYIYQLFMRLATKRYQLDDEEEGDQEQEFINSTTFRLDRDATMADAGQVLKQARAASMMNVYIRPLTQHAATRNAQKPSIVQRCAQLLTSWFGQALKPSTVVPESKRRLLPCWRATMRLVWPLTVWGSIVIICSSLGYMLLKATFGPVAMVNYVNLLYNQNSFYLQELAVESNVTRMVQLRQGMSQKISEFEKEYGVMLYGRGYAPLETSPHYTLIQSGLAHNTDSANVLYYTTDCLCSDPDDCNGPDSPLYADTHQGLDRMIIKYLHIGNYINKMQRLDPHMNGPEYFYFWNTRMDIKGGFTQLAQQYQNIVAKNMESVQVLHVLILSLTLILVIVYLLFVLRPFLRAINFETRRLAELLSQLPPEVDVVSVVEAHLLPHSLEEELPGAAAAAAAAIAAAGDDKPLQMKKSG